MGRLARENTAVLCGEVSQGEHSSSVWGGKPGRTQQFCAEKDMEEEKKRIALDLHIAMFIFDGIACVQIVNR